jgi:hypothetical protein
MNNLDDVIENLSVFDQKTIKEIDRLYNTGGYTKEQYDRAIQYIINNPQPLSKR